MILLGTTTIIIVIVIYDLGVLYYNIAHNDECDETNSQVAS